MKVADQLPRVFQANADRFYQRVVLGTLRELPTHDTLTIGSTGDLGEFLDRCAAQVDNHTAHEAAKAIALTLDGMFERQLSRWISAHGIKASTRISSIRTAEQLCRIDLASIGIAEDLSEMHLAANVARHGDGGSCDKLKASAPQLWDNPLLDHYDLAPSPVPASEELRIRPGDLRRYAMAIVSFWGHVDALPNAMRDPPY